MRMSKYPVCRAIRNIFKPFFKLSLHCLIQVTKMAYKEKKNIFIKTKRIRKEQQYISILLMFLVSVLSVGAFFVRKRALQLRERVKNPFSHAIELLFSVIQTVERD